MRILTRLISSESAHAHALLADTIFICIPQEAFGLRDQGLGWLLSVQRAGHWDVSHGAKGDTLRRERFHPLDGQISCTRLL